MTAQSEFIANAAHQLRNPIAGVLSLAEAVSNAPDEAAAKTRTTDLLDAARKTADLSQKLLLLERAESISPQSGHTPLDLNALLPDWVAALHASAPDTVEITLDMPSPLPVISGDPTMLREALANLIDNALTHGGAALNAIRIHAAPAEGEAVITVRDNGVGIVEADIPKALERFVGLSETSNSGLGLPIVQAIVATHGGTLRLLPDTPGLTAEIRLPASA